MTSAMFIFLRKMWSDNLTYALSLPLVSVHLCLATVLVSFPGDSWSSSSSILHSRSIMGSWSVLG